MMKKRDRVYFIEENLIKNNIYFRFFNKFFTYDQIDSICARVAISACTFISRHKKYIYPLLIKAGFDTQVLLDIHMLKFRIKNYVYLCHITNKNEIDVIIRFSNNLFNGEIVDLELSFDLMQIMSDTYFNYHLISYSKVTKELKKSLSKILNMKGFW